MTALAPRPGSIVNVRTTPPAAGVPTDTSQWFVAGTTDRGPTTPVQLNTLQDFINTFGGRQTYSVLYDAVENFFREGGTKIWCRRVTGPNPVVASVNIVDGAAAVSLIVKGKGPSANDNNLRISIVVTGGTYTVGVTGTLTDGTAVSELSPSLSTQQDAVNWSNAVSQYVAITIGASLLNPANITNSALTGGTDDRTNITDTQWAVALASFPRDLGPGQISQPGRTTTVAHAQVLLRAFLDNRFGLVDAPDSPTIGTVTAAGVAQRGLNDDCGALFAPWVVIPGLVTGTTRTVPPCSSVAGVIGRNESGGGLSPNAPAAGFGEGSLRFAIGISQPAYDNGNGVDITRDTMYSSSVNQIVFRYNNYEIFGWRTMVSETGTKQDWINAGNARFRMALVAEFLKVSENYILDEIDGRGLIFKAFQGEIEAVLMKYYLLGSLYSTPGTGPETAYRVDTGPTVNTPATIADRQLRAAVGVRMSSDAELVGIDVTKYPITQSL